MGEKRTLDGVEGAVEGLVGAQEPEVGWENAVVMGSEEVRLH